MQSPKQIQNKIKKHYWGQRFLLKSYVIVTALYPIIELNYRTQQLKYLFKTLVDLNTS